MRSALDQGEVIKRVMVVEDGSTDATAEIVTELAANDTRILLFRRENGSASSVRNLGPSCGDRARCVGGCRRRLMHALGRTTGRGSL